MMSFKRHEKLGPEHTSDGNPFSNVRALFIKPSSITHIPSLVSMVQTSNLLRIGADVNTRIACFL